MINSYAYCNYINVMNYKFSATYFAFQIGNKNFQKKDISLKDLYNKSIDGMSDKRGLVRMGEGRDEEILNGLYENAMNHLSDGKNTGKQGYDDNLFKSNAHNKKNSNNHEDLTKLIDVSVAVKKDPEAGYLQPITVSKGDFNNQYESTSNGSYAIKGTQATTFFAIAIVSVVAIILGTVIYFMFIKKEK
jgi:hypothetical protein